MIKVDVSNVISEEEIAKYSDKAASINKMINEKTGAGNDFLGWVDWPNNYDKEELERLIKDAKYVRENFDVLVVAGIGGSYLGARSALDALKGIKGVDKPEIIFTDALANIITVRNEDKCLIYNKPILNEALTWRQMVKWFEEKYGITANAEKIYIDRLRESFGIASPPEITFFDVYLEWMHEMGDDVPALIPQVYVYYDPLTKNEREWKKIFEHQIFDFFMLFHVRVIL